VDRRSKLVFKLDHASPQQMVFCGARIDEPVLARQLIGKCRDDLQHSWITSYRGRRTWRASIPLVLDTGAKPLDEFLEIAEFPWTDLPPHLVFESLHQCGSDRVAQVRQCDGRHVRGQQ